MLLGFCRKGEKTMVFIYNKKNYSVNVKNVFDEAKSDDYVDVLDAFGVIIHSLSRYPEFGNSTIVLFYNEITGIITVEINDENNDDYCIIDEVKITQEERELIENKLQCE